MRKGNPVSRRLAVALVAVAVAIAGALHYGHNFTPGERAGAPSPELAVLLGADASFERALWLASPHQNLGALDERVGDLELYLAELSRFAGTSTPRLPSFGPFAVPPARELALAWDGTGERFLGVARIESGIGWLARVAGRVAGNPWLAGGQVQSGGRTFEIRWQGPLWIVASGVEARLPLPPGAGPAADVALVAPASPATPAIAILVLQQAAGFLPPGRSVLRRGSDGLEVRSGALPDAVQAASDWTFPGIALWLSSTDRGPIGGPGLFLLWEAAEGAVPRVAVLQRGGGRSFRLPGESLLALVGAGEPAMRLGWSVRATQRSAQREALLLVPWFERHLVRPGRRGAWLGRAGRLVPAASARTLHLLVSHLEKLPLVPPAEVRRMAAAAALLAPFADCQAIAFEIWHEPEGARLRLCSRSEAAEAESEEASSSEDREIDAAPPIR